MQFISFFKGKNADEVQVSKTHKSTCTKHDILGFKGLKYTFMIKSGQYNI